MTSQLTNKVAMAISNKIKLNFVGQNVNVSKFDDNNTGFLIKTTITLKEIHEEIENFHLKLIEKPSIQFVDEVIISCERALISINSIIFKIEIISMDSTHQIKINKSPLIKSLFCELFSSLQYICEEKKNQVNLFLTSIEQNMALFKKKFSFQILQSLETSLGKNYNYFI